MKRNQDLVGEGLVYPVRAPPGLYVVGPSRESDGLVYP
jgi:hypothetical protein